jgi:hypothetical protein
VILVALALLGLGSCDMVRWTPDRVERSHALVAAAAGSLAVAAVASLSGMDCSSVLLAGAVSIVVLSLWSAYDLLPHWAKPEYALALVASVVVVLIALSGSAEPIGGRIAVWYSNLGFGFVRDVGVDQFVLAVGATLFLLASANRIVRFTLIATAPSLLKGEDTMRGGRLLGPMERLIVAAAVVSGNAAGAGFVIAAKGLLRFREIRGGDQLADQRLDDRRQNSEDSTRSKVDEITEYFLVGTFTSVLVAATMGALVLACA